VNAEGSVVVAPVDIAAADAAVELEGIAEVEGEAEIKVEVSVEVESTPTPAIEIEVKGYNGNLREPEEIPSKKLNKKKKKGPCIFCSCARGVTE